VAARSNAVAWCPVHRSVYSARVNWVFGEIGVRCNACECDSRTQKHAVSAPLINKSGERALSH